MISTYPSPKAEDKTDDTLVVFGSHCPQFKDISTHLICKSLDLGEAEELGFWKEALGMHIASKT